jgi:fatty-acid peroxygenase
LEIPSLPGFDQSISFVREGYEFIRNRCTELGTDVFQGRLMLQKVICLRGAAAAELFYDGGSFTRNGAMPVTILMLLQDYGSVQLLDDLPHRHRKAMFRVIGRPDAAKQLAAQLEKDWAAALPRWQRADQVNLFEEMELLLARSGATWAGIPMDESEVRKRAHEYSKMLAATGSAGPSTLRALWLRQRTERWARDVIQSVRNGKLVPRRGVAVRTIAEHRDLNDELLTVKTAAVELINVLRAIVAVARFIVFAAKALHEHPEARQRILSGDEVYLEHFVQEVRRTAPFFPAIGGRARKDLQWRHYRIQKGAWLLLDLYGTNRDPRSWVNPDLFNPERFADKCPSPFELIPQGAGDASHTHRCPGEDLTLELMKTAVRGLCAMSYVVPEQDLSVDTSRIPALPKSGFVMKDILPAPRLERSVAAA